MKTSIIYIALISIILTAFIGFSTYHLLYPKQAISYTKNQVYTNDTTLIVQVKINQPYTAIAYASVFNCYIEKVIRGNLKESTIAMTILAGHEYKDSILNEALIHPKTLEIGFKKNNENEPYHTMPIDGFVDDTKTSWTIYYIKSIEP